MKELEFGDQAQIGGYVPPDVRDRQEAGAEEFNVD